MSATKHTFYNLNLFNFLLMKNQNWSSTHHDIGRGSIDFLSPRKKSIAIFVERIRHSY